jgi:hypothetical protein
MYRRFVSVVARRTSRGDRRREAAPQLEPFAATITWNNHHSARFSNSCCGRHIPQRQAKGSPSFRVNSPSPPILEHSSYLEVHCAVALAISPLPGS